MEENIDTDLKADKENLSVSFILLGINKRMRYNLKLGLLIFRK